MNKNMNKSIFNDLFLKIHILILFGKVFPISDTVCIKVFGFGSLNGCSSTTNTFVHYHFDFQPFNSQTQSTNAV